MNLQLLNDDTKMGLLDSFLYLLDQKQNKYFNKKQEYLLGISHPMNVMVENKHSIVLL